MRQMTSLALTALIALQSAGCENRVPKVIGSQVSPDGEYVIWITEEIGGIRSGVTTAYLAKSGRNPEDKNEILRSPECEGVKLAWSDDGEIIIAYDEIYGSFQSELRSITPKVSLVRNTDLKKMGFEMNASLAFPCDPL